MKRNHFKPDVDADMAFCECIIPRYLFIACIVYMVECVILMPSLISSALKRYIGIPVVCDYELVLYSRDFCRCAIVLIEISKLAIRNKEQ